jgi:hypothetical protein
MAKGVTRKRETLGRFQSVLASVTEVAAFPPLLLSLKGRPLTNIGWHGFGFRRLHPRASARVTWAMRAVRIPWVFESNS